MGCPDLSDRVREYLPMVEGLARQLKGVSGAEYDDLVQEGLISVWQALAKSREPSAQVARGRMLNWCRYLRRNMEDPTILDIEDGDAV